MDFIYWYVNAAHTFGTHCSWSDGRWRCGDGRLPAFSVLGEPAAAQMP
jgi:hypothetical protein